MSSSALERAVADGDLAGVLHAVRSPTDETLRPGEVGLLERAAALVAPGADDPLPTALAWRWGYALHQTGSFARALDVYARAQDRYPADPVDLAFLLSSTASSLWATGDAVASRRAADAALATALGCGDDPAIAAAWVSQALVCVLEGDLDANLVAYEKGLAAAERAGDVLTQARIHNNLGSRCNSEGRYTDALPHLDRAIALAESVSAPPPVRALSLTTRSESLLGLGRLEECLAELHLARALTRTSESPLLGLAVVGIGDANRLCGNATQAAIAYREALVIAERTGNAQIAVPALSGLARALVVDDVDEAQGLVKRALDQPAAAGQVDPLLAAGWVCLATGDRDTAGEFSRLAVREAGRRHESRGLAEALELQSLLSSGARALDLLDEAATLWLGADNAVGVATNQSLCARATGDTVSEQAARRRLRALGVRDDALRIAGPLQGQHPYPRRLRRPLRRRAGAGLGLAVAQVARRPQDPGRAPRTPRDPRGAGRAPVARLRRQRQPTLGRALDPALGARPRQGARVRPLPARRPRGRAPRHRPRRGRRRRLHPDRHRRPARPASRRARPDRGGRGARASRRHVHRPLPRGRPLQRLRRRRP